MKKILVFGSILLLTLAACGTGGDKSFDNSDSIGPSSPDTSSMQTLPPDSLPQDSVSTTGRSGNR